MSRMPPESILSRSMTCSTIRYGRHYDYQGCGGNGELLWHITEWRALRPSISAKDFCVDAPARMTPIMQPNVAGRIAAEQRIATERHGGDCCHRACHIQKNFRGCLWSVAETLPRMSLVGRRMTSAEVFGRSQKNIRRCLWSGAEKLPRMS